MTKSMMKSIMEKNITKARDDYYPAITKTLINGKTAHELKGRFLDDFQKNAFSETNGENVVEHIENFLKIVEPLVFPNNDGEYCNGGNLPRTFRVGNMVHYQDLEWYEVLEDVKLKDEAFKNKAIIKGLIDEDEESYNEAWRR
nr:hypothetical protein [Tanacetum cinerariifolium]